MIEEVLFNMKRYSFNKYEEVLFQHFGKCKLQLDASIQGWISLGDSEKTSDLTLHLLYD